MDFYQNLGFYNTFNFLRVCYVGVREFQKDVVQFFYKDVGIISIGKKLIYVGEIVLVYGFYIWEVLFILKFCSLKYLNVDFFFFKFF